MVDDPIDRLAHHLTFFIWFSELEYPDTIRLISGQDTTLTYATFCNLQVEETKSIQVTSSDVSPNDQILLTSESGEDYSQTEAVVSLFGVIPLKKVSVEIWPQMDLIPMGKAIGVDMRTDGVLVLGLGEVTDAEGNHVTPARNQLFSGDRIYSLNGENIRVKEDVIEKIGILWRKKCGTGNSAKWESDASDCGSSIGVGWVL